MCLRYNHGVIGTQRLENCLGGWTSACRSAWCRLPSSQSQVEQCAAGWKYESPGIRFRHCPCGAHHPRLRRMPLCSARGRSERHGGKCRLLILGCALLLHVFVDWCHTLSLLFDIAVVAQRCVRPAKDRICMPSGAPGTPEFGGL
jgi:hypothetical protein